MKFTLALVSGLIGAALANPAPVVQPDGMEKRFLTVTANVPAGSIVGLQSLLGTENFAGIPYALPPTGNLRLRPPVRLNATLSNFDATSPAPACPQMFAQQGNPNDFLSSVISTLTNIPLVQQALKVSENCLTIDVYRPKGTKAGDNLPVLYWMFGGGFELGWASTYDASGLISAAARNGKPYIFVAVNYRVGAYGWLGGKEVLAGGAANLGHLDQRMGLEWVADNIAAFGGDPSKVTIWGESAGSISVWNQMSLYDGNNIYKGKPLFRGAIMDSGSIIPAEPIDGPKAQAIYDRVVNSAGCSGQADTLQCLRNLPYDQFQRAANSVPGILSYSALDLSYLPRPDGKVLSQSAENLLLAKKYAAVPMIIGDQEDEGTLFSLFQANTTGTTAKLVNYLGTGLFRNCDQNTLNQFVNLYPVSFLEGSPFRTGIFNELYPGFKRLAAILGDVAFTITRRVFLKHATALNPQVPAWSYIASYDYGTPVLGTFHASDLLQVFFGVLPNYASKNVQAYYANFVYNLNPNDASGGTGTGTKVPNNWPQWQNNNPQVQNFYAWYFQTISDNFRQNVADFLETHIASFRI